MFESTDAPAEQGPDSSFDVKYWRQCAEASQRLPDSKKRPYHKPAVRHEPVFETRALVCGKVQTTQANCAHRRYNS